MKKSRLMTKIATLSLVSLLFAGCSNGESEAEELSVFGDGVVSEDEESSNASMAFQFVEKYDKIDNYDIRFDDIEVSEIPENKVDAADGTIYENLYDVKVSYTWQDRIYDVSSVISWTTSDTFDQARCLAYVNSNGTIRYIETEDAE
jgi:hypothetical protein